MSEDKNIDRLFQEKLKDLEITPNPEVWNAIEEKLHKKKRRIVPFWWISIGSTAACIFILSLLFWKKNDEVNIDNNNPPIITEKNAPVKEKSIDILLKETEEEVVTTLKEKNKEKLNFKRNNTEILTEKNNQSNSIVSFRAPKIKPDDENISKSEIISNHPRLNQVAETKPKEEIKKNQELTISEKNNLPEVDLSISKKINKEEIIDENKDQEKTENKTFITELSEKDTEIIKENDEKKWKINPVLGILQSNSFSAGSSIDNSISAVDFIGDNNFTYGVNIEYQLNDKWSLRSGVQLQKSSFTSEKISTISQVNLLSYFSSIDVIQVTDSGNNLTNSPDFTSNPLPDTAVEGEDVIVLDPTVFVDEQLDVNRRNQQLKQIYSYVEVPLEMKYTFFKREKIKMNVISGFSTLLLYEKKIISLEEGIENDIGELTNLNPINFSANLGLDFDVLLFDELHFNINPMFKVQLNTFNDSSNNFQPYILGIYSGLKYQF